MGLSSDHICAPFGDLNAEWKLYKAANYGFRAVRFVELMNWELGSYSWVAGGTTIY